MKNENLNTPSWSSCDGLHFPALPKYTSGSIQHGAEEESKHKSHLPGGLSQEQQAGHHTDPHIHLWASQKY